MWSELYLAIVALAAMLFAPGYLLLRAFSLPRAWSVCVAPVISVSLITVWCQLLSLAGVSVTPVLALVPAVVLPVVCLVVLRALRFEPLRVTKMPGWAPALFLLMGLFLGHSLYLSRLTSTDIIYQSYDLTQHLNLIRAMADSGHLSSLGTNYYLSPADAAISPAPTGMFYPAAWHALCALVVQATGFSAPIAINASMFLFPAIVYPLAMCAFLCAIFPGQPRLLGFGAVVTLAFVIFPWGLVIFGPVYPNVAGFCAMPASMALFVLLSSHDADYRDRAVFGLALLVSFAALALLHPNTLFTCAVILVPYCVHRIAEELKGRGAGAARTAAACAGFLLVCAAFWYVCYKLPMFQGTVSHVWKPYARPLQQLVNIFTQTYVLGFWGEVAVQYALAPLVIAGIVTSLYSHSNRWMSFSYGIAAFICLYSTTQANSLKQLLAGFWYTDPMRLASMCCIAAVPLAALGINWLYGVTLDLVTSYNVKRRRPTHVPVVVGAVAAVFLAINFMPEFNLPGMHRNETMTPGMTESLSNIEPRDYAKNFHTTFGDYRSNFKSTYGFDYPLDLQEKRFVTNVKEIVGDDLVLNDPMDGSFLAYGYADLRVYYRDFVGYGNENETTESLLIRKGLSDIANDDAVRDAVKRTGAKYVMVLNKKGSDFSMLNIRGDYNDSVFAGVDCITLDTKGFTCVFRSGTMCLYHIDD